MTPLATFLAERRAAFMAAQWYANASFERRSKREIHAMAVVAHRGIGQRFRYAARRLRTQQGGNP